MQLFTRDIIVYETAQRQKEEQQTKLHTASTIIALFNQYLIIDIV